MCAVALDEAHEMLVNKDIKTTKNTSTRSTAKRCKQLKEQISPPSAKESTVSIFYGTPMLLAVRKM